LGEKISFLCVGRGPGVSGFKWTNSAAFTIVAASSIVRRFWGQSFQGQSRRNASAYYSGVTVACGISPHWEQAPLRKVRKYAFPEKIVWRSCRMLRAAFQVLLNWLVMAGGCREACVINHWSGKFCCAYLLFCVREFLGRAGTDRFQSHWHKS